MMQTRIPAPAQANKQQSHSAQHPAQLLAGQQSAFADHRPLAAQLTSLQAKMNGCAQAQQMRTLQTQIAGSDVAQRESLEEPLQAQVDGEAVQREEAAAPSEAPKPNNTGLPDNLKSGIESLSGMSMDHVKVHYNSSQPAQLNAHAYAQGSEIHIAPGQEQHVPHEAWHVVQQAQGRVKPTMQMKMGMPVNDDAGLETEADVMGAKALGLGAVQMRKEGDIGMLKLTPPPPQPIQQKEHKNSSFMDVNVQKKVLHTAKGANNGAIQKYSYEPNPAEITANLPKGTQKWTESISSKVTWDEGEVMDPGAIGSHVVNNHGWFGLLKNQSNGNNATGLHVVNANWGGSANALNGNLVPGTPSLNGHHKSIENVVHNLFKNNGGTAPDDMSYKADVITPYPQTIDLTKKKSGEEILFKDPSIKCTVTVGSETPVDNVEVELGGGTKIVVP